MGLHRRQSLLDNFKELTARELAVQVFWVVYELDRRWSFGTSLSFALNDRDIDPQLPEPGKDYPYLKAMVAFAKLCSRVWEALPPYGSSLQLIPQETEDYLDFITQNWLQVSGDITNRNKIFADFIPCGSAVGPARAAVQASAPWPCSTYATSSTSSLTDPALPTRKLCAHSCPSSSRFDAR